MELKKSIFFSALGLATVFYCIVKFSLGYWKRRGILHYKPAFLWGNTKGIGLAGNINVHAILESYYQQYKGKAAFMGFYAFIKPYVLVLDLALVQQILHTNAKYFMARGLYHNLHESLTCNLLQLDGPAWQSLHEKVRPIFELQQLENIYTHLVDIGETYKRTMVAKHKLSQRVNINELVTCYNMDVLSTLVFGLSSDSLRYPETEFRQMTRLYLQNFSPFKAYMALEYPAIARLLNYRSYAQKAAHYFQRLVSDKIMELAWQRDRWQPSDSFLKLLLLENAAQGMSAEEITAQLFSFVLLGLMPFNATLTFCIYELALQPELQRCARKEIEQVLQRSNGQLTTESLKDFVYLKQVIKETLRLHCPYPLLLRQTLEDYELPDGVFMLAKGNNIIIPIAALQRDESYYPEPTRFDPTRFDANKDQKCDPMSFLAFGGGPRGCIAQHFAETQLLVGLVTLLQNYEFSPCADTPILVEYNKKSLLLMPKSDITLCMDHMT